MIQTLALAAAAAAILLPLPAHASIVGTNPEDGATITALPEAFTVTVNEDILDVEGSSSNVVLVTDQDGAYYGDGCSTVDGATLSTAAQLGDAGVYTMRYGLVSADGHPIEGVVTFAWEPDASATTVAGVAEAPVCGEAAPSASASESATPSAEPSTSAPSATEPPSSTTAPSTPATGGESEEGDGGIPPIAFIGIGIALLAAVATVLVITFRRGRRREASLTDGPEDPNAG